ncbi:MAG TPA: tail fiber domain-containing protein [Chitinophagaceae bacterium]
MKKILFLAGFNYIFLFVSAQPEPANNVGIGTSTPTRAKLEVHGAVGSTSAIFGGESSGISLQRNWPAIGFNHYNNNGGKYMSNGFAAAQFLDPNGGYIAFDMYPSGASNGTITSSNRALLLSTEGRVGVGGIYPVASLDVARGTSNEGAAVFRGTTYNSYFNYSLSENTYIRPGKANGKVIINDVPGGQIAMGDGSTKVSLNNGLNPYYSLEIRQVDQRGLGLIDPTHLYDTWEIRTFLNSIYAPHSDLELDFNGTRKVIILHEDGEYYNVSDGRLKTNIQKAPSLIEKILQLQPVTYKMKSDGLSTKIGFIAQEVKQLFPELVRVTHAPGNYEGINDLHLINYSSFGVLAIKAIQEQQQMIEVINKEIELLKEQNKMLLQLIKNKN